MADFAIDDFTFLSQSLGDGDAGFVAKSGAIFTPNVHAVTVSGDASLTVFGSITAGPSRNGVSVDQSTNDDGVDLQLHVGVGGAITGGGAGLHMRGGTLEMVNNGELGGSFNGVNFVGDQSSIVNTGVISGGGDGLDAALIADASFNNQIVNTGEIVGTHFAVFVSGETTLSNSGVISGGNLIEDQDNPFASAAYRGANNIDTIYNSGLMNGAIRLGLNDDLYEGDGGRATGPILGELGDDTIRGGAFREEIFGGDGKDILSGRGGDDQIDGGAHTDIVKGGAGGDVISGGSGGDKLRGNDGDDQVLGGGGADTALGGRGDDHVSGGSGDDRINGGRGDDFLEGGSGADIFIFGLDAGDDLIDFFEDGADQIDLTRYGLDSFADVSAALTEAGGAVRLDFDAIGGSGSVWIGGLALVDTDASDFIL